MVAGMNKAIVVTGIGGYLAFHLIPELLRKNYKVYGIDIKDHDLIIESHQSENLVFIKNEFRKAKKKIIQLLRENHENITSFVHFSGISDAIKCNKNPLAAFNANVNHTMEVLDFCREQNIQKFYFPSTGLVYGEHRINQSWTEESLLNPLNFYAWTKYIAEKTIESYCSSFGLQSIVMRINNIIGYPLKIGTIVNDIFSQVRNEAKEVIIKDGNPIRDFIFIRDAVSALVSLLEIESNSNFEIYNVSSGIGIPAMELAHMICTINDLPVSIVKSQKPIDSNPPALVLENSKLKQTGWSPKYSIEASIKEIKNFLI